MALLVLLYFHAISNNRISFWFLKTADQKIQGSFYCWSYLGPGRSFHACNSHMLSSHVPLIVTASFPRTNETITIITYIICISIFVFHLLSAPQDGCGTTDSSNATDSDTTDSSNNICFSVYLDVKCSFHMQIMLLLLQFFLFKICAVCLLLSFLYSLSLFQESNTDAPEEKPLTEIVGKIVETSKHFVYSF